MNVYTWGNSIPGERLPGVYTAGSAQRFSNLENICVDKKIFILGSGDVGLIMARRFTLEGSLTILIFHCIYRIQSLI